MHVRNTTCECQAHTDCVSPGSALFAGRMQFAAAQFHSLRTHQPPTCSRTRSIMARKRHHDKKAASGDDECGYEVENIVAVKEEKGMKMCRVKWVDYEELTCELESNLDCPERIAAFEAASSTSAQHKQTSRRTKQKLSTPNRDAPVQPAMTLSRVAAANALQPVQAINTCLSSSASLLHEALQRNKRKCFFITTHLLLA